MSKNVMLDSNLVNEANQEIQQNYKQYIDSENIENNSLFLNITVPEPPYFGHKDIIYSAEEILKLLDQDRLFKYRWGYQPKKDSDFDSLMKDNIKPMYNEFTSKLLSIKDLVTCRVGYYQANTDRDSILLYENGVHYTTINVYSEYTNILQHFLPQSSNKIDILAMSYVVLSNTATEHIEGLIEREAYRDYYLMHCLFAEIMDTAEVCIQKKIVNDLKLTSPENGKHQSENRLKETSVVRPMLPGLYSPENLNAILGIMNAGDHNISKTSEGKLNAPYSNLIWVLHRNSILG